MASSAQINANLLNAQASTGPITADGKNNSSKNAIKFGLFSKRDFVPEECQDAYQELRRSLLEQLKPASALENVIVNEIISASWRLERCAQNEANLEVEASPAIDRARASAARILWKAMAELRKLQTERCIRLELDIADEEGLASVVETFKGMAAPVSLEHLEARRLEAECNAKVSSWMLAPPPTSGTPIAQTPLTDLKPSVNNNHPGSTKRTRTCN